MFLSRNQAVNAVASEIVKRDASLTPLVNGLLSVFGHPTVSAPLKAVKAEPVATPSKTTDKEQRSGLFVVDSSVIDTVEYKAPRRLDTRRPHLKRAPSKLIVNFVNGSRYEYKGVSQRTFDNLIAAKSQGEFFNENIKDQYPTRRLDK